MKYKEIRDELKKELKPARYTHTMGVVETARTLAEAYDCKPKKAKYAALLHDCAKSITDNEKIDLCRKYGVPVSDTELHNPGLLHAKCGAILAKNKYGIEDRDILHAIAVHTTGVPDMNLLDQILFISDYIEPNRKEAPNLDTLRKLALTDPDQTTYLILKDTISYLNTRHSQALDPTTWEAYKYYKDKVKGE